MIAGSKTNQPVFKLSISPSIKMKLRVMTSLIPMLLILFICSDRSQADTNAFDSVAEEIGKEYNRSQIEKNETLSAVQNERATLTAKLAALKNELSQAEQKLAEDTALLEALAQQRETLKKDIATHLVQKEELDTIISENARNFLGRAEKSPFSAENPERLSRTTAITSQDEMVGMDDIKALLDLSFQDMAVSGTRSSYTGMVLNRSGAEAYSDVIRLGHMAALYRTTGANGSSGSSSEESESGEGDSKGAVGYLTLSPASGRLVMSASPPYLVRRNLNAFMRGESKEVPIDISGGVAISQLARQATFMDQMRSGGILVIPILLVGVVALILTIERLIFLGRVRQNTDALMTRVTQLVSQGDIPGALEATSPHRKRPTGKVLMAGLHHRGESRGVIESALSEAILRETPRLERFLGALKVSAAVAPLLGLLGTVTGMINTFQVITTHGTGDPRLMAGGISEAMVTTQVGLAVAIPIMIVAAWLGRRAHTLSQDMEEKGLALMAALLKSSDTIFNPSSNSRTGKSDKTIQTHPTPQNNEERDVKRDKTDPGKREAIMGRKLKEGVQWN